MDTPIGDTPKEARERTWKEVMMAVNNYPGQDTMTREDLKAKLEASFSSLDGIMKLNELRREALIISGYKLEEKKPGESLAAAAAA